MLCKKFTVLAFVLLLPSLCFAQPDPKFKRGAKPTPPHKIAAAILAGRATVHKPILAAPSQISMIPSRLSYWGNDQYGICVSAESAFAIGSYSKHVKAETFITESEIISWARSHGVLNGADLLSVIEDMQRDGVKDEKGVLRKEGIPSIVNFSNEANLQSAIATGPISIAIAADDLPSGAGSKTGWFAFGGGRAGSTDHCVSLLGYGPAKYCFDVLGVPVPANAPTTTCYLLFTWNTIGVVDHKWIMGTTEEAWLRTPTVLGLQPPGPPDPPPPDPVGTLTITPAAMTLLPKGVQQFTASLPKVIWFTDSGTITQTGAYTAPEAPGTATVVALSVSPFAAAQATVTVSTTPPAPTGPTIIIGPDVRPGVYVYLKPGMELAPAGTVAELERIKGALNKLLPNSEPPTKIEVKETEPPLIEKPKVEKKEPEKKEEEPAEPVEPEPPAPPAPSYEEQRERAVRVGSPFIVGVSCDPPKGEWLTARVEAPFKQWQRECVIISVPSGGDLIVRATLPPGTTAASVRLRLGK